MKKRRLRVILVSILVVVIAAVITCIIGGNKMGLLSKKAAIDIAVNEIGSVYSGSIKIDDYDFNVIDNEDEWIVYLTLKKKSDILTFGGGGPCIVINKDTGRVISISRQK